MQLIHSLKQTLNFQDFKIGTGRNRARLLNRMRPSARLLRTSAFRLALIYAALFSALSALTLGFIYWSTRDQIESQVDTRLRLETDYLINLYKSGAVEELLEAIQRRNQIDTYERFYSLTRGSPAITNHEDTVLLKACLLYTSPSPRDQRGSRMPSSA